MVDRQVLHSKIRDLLEDLNLWDKNLVLDLPKKWEKHGDGVIFPNTSFQNPIWTDPAVEQPLYHLICAVMKVRTVARKSGGILHNVGHKYLNIIYLYCYYLL